MSHIEKGEEEGAAAKFSKGDVFVLKNWEKYVLLDHEFVLYLVKL